MGTAPPASGTRVLDQSDGTSALHFRCSKLEVLSGNSAGAELNIEGTTIRAGSAPENDLVLADDTVSTHHFEIRVTEEGYLLIDSGSTNGTFVDGTRVREVYLNERAEIAAGETRLLFEIVEGEVTIPVSKRTNFGELLGHSPPMRAVFAVLERAAPTDITMLVTGESGTGKELAARALHESSPRRDAPYVVFDCGATTPTLIESQLFGHVRGAFTGATDAREGVFEQANGGTLVFDELGELPLDLQPKLLRAIESRTITRVGDNKTREVDLRIVACTNRNLEEEVKEGRFREDLYFRLSVVRVKLPPLRERPEELPRLVRKFLSARGIDEGEGMPAATLALLRSHTWPGNVRELRNVVERFVIMPDLDPSFWFSPDGASQAAGAPAPSVNLDDGFHDAKRHCVDAFERQYLMHVQEAHADNASEAARVAGLSRQSYYRLLSKHGLRTE